MSENLPVHVSAKSPPNISPNPTEVIQGFGTLGKLFPPKTPIVQGVESSYFCYFRTLGHIFKISPFSSQKCHFLGGWNPYYCELILDVILEPLIYSGSVWLSVCLYSQRNAMNIVAYRSLLRCHLYQFYEGIYRFGLFI